MDGIHDFDNASPAPVDNTSRMPQYNDANESASEKGQASSEPILHNVHRPATVNIAPSTSATTALAPSTETDDTIGAGWEDLGSEAAARPAPSTSGAQNVPTPATSVFATLVPGSAAGAMAAGSQLTAANIDFLNIMNKSEDSYNERLWLFNHGQSTIVSSGLFLELGASNTRASVRSPTDLGESPVLVNPENVKISDIFGIGLWADEARPPTA